MLIDTGAPSYRRQCPQRARNVIELADVRWVFLTHDDHDHAGHLRMVARDLRRLAGSETAPGITEATP